MEYDATQALPISDYDDETDEETETKNNQPVAYLKVAPHKDFQETSFPIYEGNNIIGRQEICNIHIPLKSLSKQHAIIEVHGDQHFVVDKGSSNKTRRGKLFLTPEARYELRDGDKITFADVHCTYAREESEEQLSSPAKAAKKEVSASETGSESMLFNEKNKNEGETFLYEEDDDDDDEPSSDILQPTQPAAAFFATQAYAPDGSGPQKMEQKDVAVYAEDSDTTDDESALHEKVHTPFASTQKVVAETPGVKAIPESPCGLAETQIYEEPCDQNLNNRVMEQINTEPTQAYVMDSETDDEDQSLIFPLKNKDTSILDQPTQAFTLDVGTPQSGKGNKGIEQTMKYEMDIESTQTAEEIKQLRASSNQNEKQCKVSVDVENAPTQTFPDSDSERTLPPPTPQKKLDLCAETMAYEFDDSDVEEGADVQQTSHISKNGGNVHQPGFDDATQLVTETENSGKDFECETQIIETPQSSSKPKKTVNFCNEPTQIFGNDDATQVLDVSSKCFDASNTAVAETQLTGEEATQVIEVQQANSKFQSGDNDPTQKFCEETQVLTVLGERKMKEHSLVDPDAATQVLGASVKIFGNDDATQVLDVASKCFDASNTAVAETQLMGEEATQVIEVQQANSKFQSGDNEPTQKFCEETQVLTVLGERKMKEHSLVDPDAATQVLGASVKEAVNASDATQLFNDDDDDNDDDAPTQLFTKDPVDSNSAETQVLDSTVADTQIVEAHISDDKQETVQATQTYRSDLPTPTLLVTKSKALLGNSKDNSTPPFYESDATQIFDTQTPEIIVSESTLAKRSAQSPGTSFGFSPPACSTQNTVSEVPKLQLEITPEHKAKSSQSFADEPTQIFEQTSFSGDSAADTDDEGFVIPKMPPMKAASNRKVSTTMATQKFDESEGEKSIQNTDDVCTQVFEKDNVKSLPDRSELNQDESDNDATQPYELNTEEGSDHDKAVENNLPSMNTDLLATQAYSYDNDDDADSDDDILIPNKPLATKSNTDTVETQAYGFDSTDLMATQAYSQGHGEVIDRNMQQQDLDSKQASKEESSSSHFPSLKSAGLVAEVHIKEASKLQSGEESVDNVPASISNITTSADPLPGPVKDDDDVESDRNKSDKMCKKGRRGRKTRVNIYEDEDTSTFVEKNAQDEKTDTKKEPEDTNSKSEPGTSKELKVDDNKDNESKPKTTTGRRGRRKTTGTTDVKDENPSMENMEELTNDNIDKNKSKHKTVTSRRGTRKISTPIKDVQDKDTENENVAKELENNNCEQNECETKKPVGKRGRKKVTVEKSKDDISEDNNVAKASASGRRGRRKTCAGKNDENSNVDENNEVHKSNIEHCTPATVVVEDVQLNQDQDQLTAGGDSLKKHELAPVSKGKKCRQTRGTKNQKDSETDEIDEHNEDVNQQRDNRKRPSTLINESTPSKKTRGMRSVAESPENVPECNLQQGRRGRPRVSQQNKKVTSTRANTRASNSRSTGPVNDNACVDSKTISTEDVYRKPSTRRKAAASPARSDTSMASSCTSSTRQDRENQTNMKTICKGKSKVRKGKVSKKCETQTQFTEELSPSEVSIDCQSDEENKDSPVISDGFGPSLRKNRKGRPKRNTSIVETITSDSHNDKDQKKSIISKAKHKNESETLVQGEEKIDTSSRKRMDRKVKGQVQNEIGLNEEVNIVEENDHNVEKVLRGKGKGKGKRSAKTNHETEIKSPKKSQKSDILDDSSSSQSSQSSQRGRKRPRSHAAENLQASQSNSQRKRHKTDDTPATPTRALLLSVASSNSPTLRRRGFDGKPKVMFTGMVDAHGEKTVKSLGGEIVSSIQECTHLVTDKVRRTVKFLCGMAKGINIVDTKWLEQCRHASMFIDATPYLVKDHESEEKFDFKLIDSIKMASESSLLEGWKIHVTPHVKPDPSQMKEIINCAGGQYLATSPKKCADNMLVISCEEDKSKCKAALTAGIAVVSAEFILTGILQHRIDVEKHQLFKN